MREPVFALNYCFEVQGRFLHFYNTFCLLLLQLSLLAVTSHLRFSALP